MTRQRDDSGFAVWFGRCASAMRCILLTMGAAQEPMPPRVLWFVRAMLLSYLARLLPAGRRMKRTYM